MACDVKVRISQVWSALNTLQNIKAHSRMCADCKISNIYY